MARAADVIGPLFPHIKQLDNTPEERLRQQIRTTRQHPCQHPDCPRHAHFVIPASKDYWCRFHLPETDRKKLDMTTQMRIVLRLARHVDNFNANSFRR